MTGCQLCDGETEVWSQVLISDPSTGSEGAVDVCLRHYEDIEQVIE